MITALNRCAQCCVLLSAVAVAQSRPEFEVASIRPLAEQLNQASVGVRITGSEVRVGYMSLRDYIGIAYRVRSHQITGPEWLGRDRFDIIATLPAGASPAQVPEMFQALLADRFQMTMHRDTKEFPVYALGVAKGGPTFQESPADPKDAIDQPAAVDVSGRGTGAGVAVDLGRGSSFTFGNNRLEARKMTMAALADTLTRFVDRPVVDMTGLAGRYDLTIEIAPEDYTGMLVRSAINAGVVLPPQALRVLDGASSDPLSAPLRNIGLTLDARKAPLEVVVIDTMSKTPTDN